jgi:hypothetical protein
LIVFITPKYKFICHYWLTNHCLSLHGFNIYLEEFLTLFKRIYFIRSFTNKHIKLTLKFNSHAIYIYMEKLLTDSSSGLVFLKNKN